MRSYMRKDQIEAAIVKTTRMLAQKGITVTQRGTGAYCKFDPKTGAVISINLPVLPDTPTDEFMDALQGYLDHEVAHALYTDAVGAEKVVQASAFDKNLAQRLTNVLEDVRIEAVIPVDLPGTEANLNKLRQHIIDTVWAPLAEKSQAKIAAGTISPQDLGTYKGTMMIPFLRAIGGQRVCEDFVKAAKLDELFEPMMQAIPDLQKRVVSMGSTVDAANLAELLMKVNAPPPPPQQEEQDGEDKTPPRSQKPSDAPSEDKSEQSDEKQDEKPEDKDEGSGASKEEASEEEDDADEGESKDTDGDDGKDGEKDGSGEGTSDDDADHSGDDDSDDQGSAGTSAENDGDEEGEGSEGSDGEPGDADDESQSSGAGDQGDDSDYDEAEGDQQGGEGSDGAEDGADNGDGASSDDQIDEGFDGENESDEEKGKAGVGCDLGIDLSEIKDIDGMLEDELKGMMNGAFDGRRMVHYTKDHDRVETYNDKKGSEPNVKRIEDVLRPTIMPMQKELQRLIVARSQAVMLPGYRRGRINPSALHRAPMGDDRLFRKRQEAVTNRVAMSLVIDNSGSMGGQGLGSKIATAMQGAWAFAETLDRLKIACDVVGFTTDPKMLLHRGRDYAEVSQEVEEMAQTAGIPRSSIRWIPTYMPIYKDFDEKFGPAQKRRMAHAIENQDFLASNNDAVALEYAAQRLRTRSETRKIMLVFSDGQPACNVDNRVLQEQVKENVRRLERDGVEVIGIGIQSQAVKAFYPKHHVIQNVSELPTFVMQQLKGMLAPR